MKKLGRLALMTVLFALLITACSKEKSIDTGGSPNGKGQWEFKEGGVLFTGAVDTAFIVTATAQQILAVEGTTADGTGSFQMEIASTTITTGTYKTPAVAFQFTVAGNPYYQNDPAAVDKFSVNITKITDEEVQGTFSGEVRDAQGNVKTIVDGKFNGRLKAADPNATGQLQLWSQAACTGANQVLVKLASGETGTITQFQASAPACGAAGTANFTLSPGTYTWTAYCGSDSATGVAMITAGSCNQIEVVFGGTSAVCRLRNIAYYNPLNGTAQGSITSTMDAAFKVTKIELYDSILSSLDASFNLTYAPNRINVDANQYFDLEPGERIREFHGYADPLDNTSPKVIFSYQYDANGYMTKCLVALESLPTVTVLQLTYLWTNNNLTKVEITEAGTAEKTTIEYQYDLTKPAKSFLCFFPNQELIIFQTAVNYGKNSSNIAVKSTIKDYDASGNVINTELADFTNHSFDNNGYVKSFVITGDASVYDTDVRYVLGYKCQ